VSFDVSSYQSFSPCKSILIYKDAIENTKTAAKTVPVADATAATWEDIKLRNIFPLII
jgi:hypothetical protein